MFSFLKVGHACYYPNSDTPLVKNGNECMQREQTCQVSFDKYFFTEPRTLFYEPNLFIGLEREFPEPDSVFKPRWRQV